jgi:serine/threonine-protein kinase
MTTTQPLDAPGVRAGQILAGKYRVERVLGQGGMGVVVAATHLHLQEQVALKFVHQDAINQESVARFQREAMAAVKLKSEHVARVLDIGVLETGAPYMVMEYLEGRDLSQVVRERGPLPVHEVADYVMQACEAIAEAHAIGIVHRDLKPRNLFLTFRVDGRPLVKVLDFGISKFSVSAQSGENMSLTRSQTVLGTPHYMSPEQLRTTKHVDHRTDIWALGVILYELLGGRVPFAATSMTELAAMVLQDTPQDLRELRSDVPADLCAVIARCLEKDPNARYQSVAALAHQLELFVQRDSLRPAERILAVARGSSGRQLPDVPPAPLGSTPQLASTPRLVEGDPNRRVIRSTPPGAPGGTGVTWADTQAMDPPPPVTKKRSWLVPALAGAAFAAMGLVGTGAVVLWKATHPGAASGTTATATATTTASTGTSTSTTAAASATAVATTTAAASATAATTATAAGKVTTRPAPPTTRPKGTATAKGVDLETPSDRN